MPDDRIKILGSIGEGVELFEKIINMVLQD